MHGVSAPSKLQEGGHAHVIHSVCAQTQRREGAEASCPGLLKGVRRQVSASCEIRDEGMHSAGGWCRWLVVMVGGLLEKILYYYQWC